MKNSMKSMIFGLIAIVFAMSITSCGSESEDPQPKATVAEYVGFWGFVSGSIVEQNDNVVAVNTLSCSTSTDYPQFVYEFDVRSDNTATIKFASCTGNPSVELTYNATVSGGKLTAISFLDHGVQSHMFDNIVFNSTDKTLTMKRVNGLKEAKSITLVFKVK